jgi:hypothetical protein
MNANMSAEAAEAGLPIGICPLCGNAVDESTPSPRCGTCGLHLDGLPGRTNPFRTPAFLAMLGGLVAVYGVTLGIVLATR